MYESAFAVAINDHPLSIASARQQSHDTVIANTGTDRRSGVTWTHWPAATATVSLQRELGMDPSRLPPELPGLLAQFPEGYLVVATVEVA